MLLLKHIFQQPALISESQCLIYLICDTQCRTYSLMFMVENDIPWDNYFYNFLANISTFCIFYIMFFIQQDMDVDHPVLTEKN